MNHRNEIKCVKAIWLVSAVQVQMVTFNRATCDPAQCVVAQGILGCGLLPQLTVILLHCRLSRKL